MPKVIGAGGVRDMHGIGAGGVRDMHGIGAGGDMHGIADDMKDS
jgi:hypothetical protein